MPGTDAAPLRGRCQCGAIAFEVRRVFDCRYCHCEDCRRTTGAPVSAALVARREDFVPVAGEPATHPRARGTQRFCARCGSPVWYEFRAAAGDLVSVELGLLDRPDRCVPEYHQFFSRRLWWLHVHDRLPKYPDGHVPHPDRRRRG